MTNQISGHGYKAQINPRTTRDEGTANEFTEPPSVQVAYQVAHDQDGRDFEAMVHVSPADLRMVIHVNTSETFPLGRLYVDDELVYGDYGTEAVEPPFELPRDFGGSQRFMLAERLYRQATPEPAPSLFDRPGHVQHLWARVADEAIAALTEEPAK